jgi:hypothetical protein
MSGPLDVGRLAALAAGLDGFFAGEFVGRSLGMSGLAALARDQSLLLSIH